MQHLVWMGILGLGLLLSGCMDVAQWQLRTFYGVDCREAKLVNGRCVPVKQGGNDVHTGARPMAAQHCRSTIEVISL